MNAILTAFAAIGIVVVVALSVVVLLWLLGVINVDGSIEVTRGDE